MFDNVFLAQTCTSPHLIVPTKLFEYGLIIKKCSSLHNRVPENEILQVHSGICIDVDKFCVHQFENIMIKEIQA